MYTACKGEFRDVQSDTYAKPFLHFFFFFFCHFQTCFFFRLSSEQVMGVFNALSTPSAGLWAGELL